MSRSAVELADAAIRRRVGSGFDPEAKEMFADELERQVDRLIAHVSEREEKTDRIEIAPPKPQAQPRNSAGILILTTCTAVLLVFAILAGALVGVRLADRLTAVDAAQRERIASVEARVVEAENRQIELKAKLSETENKVGAADTVLSDHERRVKILEERQSALVVYLLESTGLLLEDRGIKAPTVPPILRISEAEAELRSK